MQRIQLDIIDLLVKSPGDLIFFLLVFGLSQAALFLSISLRSRAADLLAAQRYAPAALALVGVWIAVMAVAFFSLFSSLEPASLMPPLERLAMSFTLVAIGWALLGADSLQQGIRVNFWTAGAIILILLLYLYTANEWLGEYEINAMFNASALAPLWSGVLLAIGLLGLFSALLKFGGILDAPLKCLFFLLIVLGNGWDLWQFAESEISGSYLGSARWAYLASLALAPVVIHRLIVTSLEQDPVVAIAPADRAPSGDLGDGARSEQTAARSYEESDSFARIAKSPVRSEESNLVRAVGIMMNTRENSGVPQQVAEAALDLLDAELCLLLRMEGKSYARVIAGQDKVAGRKLERMSLGLKGQPTLAVAAFRREQKTLEPDQHRQEVEELFRLLKVDAIGKVYIQPISVNDEVLALLLVGMPYRAGELNRDQRALLADIGQMAGHLLAWSFDAEAATYLAEERAIQSIIDRPPSPDEGGEMRHKARRALEASLEENTGQLARLRLQIADLGAQLHDERIAVLNRVSGGEDGVAVSQRITILFDEQSQLMEGCDALSLQILDAETLLQIYSIDNDEELAQVIREYTHKTHSQLTNVSDRLRREIDNLLVENAAIETADPQSILEPLSDGISRYELEREQLQRRLTAVISRMRALGIETELSNMTQVLIQLYAERKALRRQAAEIQHERDVLEREHAKFADGGGATADVLRNQLKSLSAEHESLLNLREEMRRDYQNLLDKLETREGENRALEDRLRDSQRQLETGAQQRSQLMRSVSDLSGERDNLLRIRDQLTARLADTLSDSTEDSDEFALRARLEELQNTVSSLNEQQEQLTLELSDANAALTAARHLQLEESDINEAATTGSQLAYLDQAQELVRAIQVPVTAISDCTEILLEESIGILGAAQLEVLGRVSLNLGRLADLLEDLTSLDQADNKSFVLTYAETDIVELLDETISALSATVGEKQLVLELSVDDDLPKISVDSDCIRQILRHLLHNACNVSATGSSVLVTVTLVSMRRSGSDKPVEAIRISVEDKGGGISQRDLPRVFARKYLHENPKIEGLSDIGVGLTVARAFARAHAGDLWIDSKVGEGSVFHLDLPTRLIPTVEE